MKRLNGIDFNCIALWEMHEAKDYFGIDCRNSIETHQEVVEKNTL